MSNKIHRARFRVRNKMSHRRILRSLLGTRAGLAKQSSESTKTRQEVCLTKNHFEQHTHHIHTFTMTAPSPAKETTLVEPTTAASEASKTPLPTTEKKRESPDPQPEGEKDPKKIAKDESATATPQETKDSSTTGDDTSKAETKPSEETTKEETTDCRFYQGVVVVVERNEK